MPNARTILAMSFWSGVRRLLVGEQQHRFDSAPMPIADMFARLLDLTDTGRPVGRDAALSVPAVTRGRNLLATVATLPLVEVDEDHRRQRSRLLSQIDPDVPNVITLAQTLDDLLFDAVSWWRVTEFEGGTLEGYPTAARHLALSSVTITPRGATTATPAPLLSGMDPRDADIYVDGVKVDPRTIIRFDGPNTGLLRVGARAVRRALLLDRMAETYADNPRPLDYFRPSDGADPADDDEIAEILRKWRYLRKRGSTGYVPASLEYVSVDQPTPADMQIVELQRRVTLDLANEIGLDPEDLGVSTTSRTYQNATDRRRDRVNDFFSLYMSAITDRLSMGDVTRRGRRVRFDLGEYLRADPATRATFYQTMISSGVMFEDEARDQEQLPPRRRPAAAADPADGATVTPIRAARGFASDGHQFADLPTTSFAVDTERRTIRGRALPYGETAQKFYSKYKFLPGSLEWSQTSRIKLLRDHSYSQALGVATELIDAPGGFEVAFRIARGEDGDKALALAADGVLDGFSVGVEFDPEVDADRVDGVYHVRRATLREVSLTAMPAFDSARVTSVRANRDPNGGQMHCQTCGQIHADGVTTCPTAPPAPPAAAPTPTATLTAEQFGAVLAQLGIGVPAPGTNVPAQQGTPPPPADRREFVNPVPPAGLTAAREPGPYRFTVKPTTGELIFRASDHDLSTDMITLAKRGELNFSEEASPEAKRVAAFMRQQFDVDSADVNELNPAINRPDMFVDQRDYRRPIWDLIGRGAPPNGIQPFLFPKYSSSSGLVGDHTEGTEPTAGAYTVTSQTVTPSALSGKVEITRETWDMGGNPAVTTLIWNQMVRAYNEGLESAAATFLNTLTAATDIALGQGVTDDALADAWETAVARLNFIRNYNLSAFVVEQELYVRFAQAEDSTGRPLYPQIGPMNTNGQSARRFTSLDLAGVEGIPSWALASTAGSSNNSWLFDPTVIWGWATPPQRLDLPGTSGTAAAPVAYIDMGIWGYKAFANTDIAGVRQVTYDTTV